MLCVVNLIIYLTYRLWASARNPLYNLVGAGLVVVYQNLCNIELGNLDLHRSITILFLPKHS